MTALLLKLFVRDHRNTQSPGVRAAVGRLAGITGIVCNCLLFLAKLVIGILSSSIALMADALNNLTDAASSVTTLLGFRMAQQPADKDHPYGHARYEYLAGLAVSFLILLIGVELGRSSFDKILHPQAVSVTGITYLILCLCIGLKLWMYLFFRNLGRRIGSTVLTATAADSRNDVIATTAVLLGCLSQQFLQLQIDGFVGLAVAGFILHSGFGIALETISPLLGQQADEDMLGRIQHLILRHDKVLGIHDLLVHDYGPGQCFASVHVEISAAENPMDSHDIIDDIERDALEELNIHLVIHYDPVALDDDEQAQLQRLVTGILSDISPDLSIHDFRLLRHGHHKRLYFDLEVPYSMELDRKDMQQHIDSRLPEGCTAIISFDRKE